MLKHIGRGFELLSINVIKPQAARQILQQIAIAVAAMFRQHQEDDTFDAAPIGIDTQVFQRRALIIALKKEFSDRAFTEQVEAGQCVVDHKFSGERPVGIESGEVTYLSIRYAIAMKLYDSMSDDGVFVGIGNLFYRQQANRPSAVCFI